MFSKIIRQITRFLWSQSLQRAGTRHRATETDSCASNRLSTNGFVHVEWNIRDTCSSLAPHRIRQVVPRVVGDPGGSIDTSRYRSRVSDSRAKALDKSEQAGDRNEASIKLHETNRRNGVTRSPANAIIDTPDEPLISILTRTILARVHVHLASVFYWLIG